MKIKIVTQSKRRKCIRFAIPNRLVLSILGNRRVGRYASSYDIVVEGLSKQDRVRIRKALKKMKREHPKLPLVEVSSADGEGVRIMP